RPVCTFTMPRLLILMLAPMAPAITTSKPSKIRIFHFFFKKRISSAQTSVQTDNLERLFLRFGAFLQCSNRQTHSRINSFNPSVDAAEHAIGDRAGPFGDLLGVDADVAFRSEQGDGVAGVRRGA